MRAESGVAAGVSSLPSGGGGIAPLGDRFQPDLVRGSGSYAVPINLPKGPNELQPGLSLTYSTGAGQGPFGLGWSLGLSRIERRTDRGVPSYTDDDDFVFGGAELLVPLGAGRYRPKDDSRFWSIDRLDDGSWRIRTGDGRTLYFGRAAHSRESGSGGDFAWCLDEEQDAAGNAVHYRYRREGGALLIEELTYSLFALRFQYEPRPDVLHHGRAGFERRTALRCHRIELHAQRLNPTLMRSYTLDYANAANGASLLTRLHLQGHDGDATAAFPDLTFSYSTPDFTRWQLDELRALVPPPGLSDPGSQLIDMNGDGLPDLLCVTGGRALRWTNRGDGWLDGPVALPGLPSVLALTRENVGLADLDGNGRTQIFAVDQPLALAFETDARGGFSAEPRVYRDVPALRLASGQTRLADVDGDGATDLMTTARDHLLLYRHDPRRGWLPPTAIRRVADLDAFPDVSFGERGVHLADMTGDGMQDMVVIRSGQAYYWPHLGNGHFARRFEMSGAPVLPPGYRDERLRLLDVDGDGCADLVYFDFDRTLIWLNRCGNGFQPPVELPVAVPPNAQVLTADFFGDGRPGFAWDARPRRDDSAGIQVLRLDAGHAPSLLTAVDNGMGGHFEVSYSTSSAQRGADRDAGRPWPGELPLVVHVVTEIRERDTVTGRTTTMAMHYHDGVWDGPERRFRGFSEVTVEMSGDDSAPATTQQVSFFQGDPMHPDLAERDRQRALAGTLVATRRYVRTEAGPRLLSESFQAWDLRLEHDGPGGRVFFPFVTQIEAREHSPSGTQPLRIERSEISAYDAHGNAGRKRRMSFAQGAPAEEVIVTEERYTYTANEVDWLVKLPVRSELIAGDGLPWSIQVRHYDGAAFIGLPESQATRGLPTRVESLRLLDSRLPDGWLGERDLAELGFHRGGAGETAGWYIHSMAVERDARGNVLRQLEPTGTQIRVVYDADGLYPVSSFDARGRETTLEFEPRSGEPLRMTFPDGRRVRHAYDPIGRLRATFETDDAGVEQLVKAWRLELGTLPCSVLSIVPSGPGSSLDDFPTDVDPESTDGASFARAYFDGFGHQVLDVATAPDASDRSRRFAATNRVELNAKGLVAVSHPPVFVATLDWTPPPAAGPQAVHQRYDAHGQVVETQGPGRTHFRVERDNFTITHFEGTGAGPWGQDAPPGPALRIEHFDAMGRLRRIAERLDGATHLVTAYEVNPEGRVLSIRDNDDALVTQYAYAGPGDPLVISNRDAGTRRYYRDAGGKLVEQVDTDGSVRRSFHDAVGRLVRMEHQALGAPEPTVMREVAYDADPFEDSAGRFLDGRIAWVRERGHEMHYAYSRSGRPVMERVSTDGVTLTTRREFDLQGRATAVVYPDGHRIAYQLDRSGSVRAINGVATAIVYGADGGVAQYRLANGVRVTLPRNPSTGRLSRIMARRGNTTLRRIEYGYDGMGSIVTLLDRQPDGIEHHRFRYDGLFRLRRWELRRDGASGTRLHTANYGYDADGNLTAMQELGPLTLEYDDPLRPGRLTSVQSPTGPSVVQYNARGQMQSFGRLAALVHDGFDRLTEASLADGTELTYGYDMHGRRILKRVSRPDGVSTVRYAAGLYEQHDDHALRHIYLGKQLICTQRVHGGAVQPAYFLCDHHGTVLMVTDAAGTPLAQQRYTPFGAARAPNQALDRYLGRAKDEETGLLHLGARNYAPTLGRFIEPDWYVLENPAKPARMPQGYNVYSYALNNPLVFKDPSGMFIPLLVGAIIAIAYVAAIVTVAAFAVGFVAGLVYGLANGQGWGSLLTALETALTTTVGMWLGGITGFLVGGPIGMIVGAFMGGMNGLVSGMTGIYDWRSIDGWLAFLSDSSWGLIGTSLGNIVHVINLFYGNANYRGDLSHRQNRHVYEGGFALKSDFAFTQGNVISNAGQGGKGINASFIAQHEELHIWQARIFGPLFQLTYIVWAVGGAVTGFVVWLFDTDQDLGSLIETAAYYDNPFEYWAYNNDSNWPPSGSNPKLRWG